ncbi:putative 41.2 kDa protein in cps region, partial [Stylophora pistillata]
MPAPYCFRKFRQVLDLACSSPHTFDVIQLCPTAFIEASCTGLKVYLPDNKNNKDEVSKEQIWFYEEMYKVHEKEFQEEFDLETDNDALCFILRERDNLLNELVKFYSQLHEHEKLVKNKKDKLALYKMCVVNAGFLGSLYQNTPPTVFHKRQYLDLTRLYRRAKWNKQDNMRFLRKSALLQHAKRGSWKLFFYVTSGPRVGVEHKEEAERDRINVVEAKRRVAYDDPHLWLSFPPSDLKPDVVIGHGQKLGRQEQIIKRPPHNCKWIQTVHIDAKEFSEYKSDSQAVCKDKEKQSTEVGLCKMAHLVEFKDVNHVPREGSDYKVLLCGRGDPEDFKLKGYDTAAKAFASSELREPSYQLIFVGALKGKQQEMKEKLLEFGIVENQIFVKEFVESREEMKRLLCEVDLAIMPSRTEGFGLVALEALSAGLPVLVGNNSGFGKQYRRVVECVE